MRPNERYLHRDSTFWAYAKWLSERLGYSKDDQVLSYSKTQAITKLHKLGIRFNDAVLEDVLGYLNYRADLLNHTVKHNLMNGSTAKEIFDDAYQNHQNQGFTSGVPFNKQSYEKKVLAYFTGIINIVTETTLRTVAQKHHLIYGVDVSYDSNPTKLSYILNTNNELTGVMSRRFDGAYPSIVNPKLIWEIKEYYFTTSFGSRVADGVYETQLDGYEVRTIEEETGHEMKHVYFIDAYDTWWNKGKSYLCRIIDMLHTGLVDEVIVGREVLERWPSVLLEAFEQQRGEKQE